MVRRCGNCVDYQKGTIFEEANRSGFSAFKVFHAPDGLGVLLIFDRTTPHPARVGMEE